jgi:hypothetical protein
VEQHPNPYPRFLVMAAIHFVAMFILMYAMVDVAANALPNLNQAYMAGLMTAPMVLLELILMGRMYPNRRLNLTLMGAAAVLLVGAFGLIRQQTAIGDAQFLRSMIPHHAGAVLMCAKAPVRDPEIQALCRNITRSQEGEIAWMKARLARLDGGR